MKKVLLILLSLALVLSMTGVVAGEHNGATKTYQDKPSGYQADPVEVSLTISEKYTVKQKNIYIFGCSFLLSLQNSFSFQWLL